MTHKHSRELWSSKHYEDNLCFSMSYNSAEKRAVFFHSAISTPSSIRHNDPFKPWHVVERRSKRIMGGSWNVWAKKGMEIWDKRCFYSTCHFFHATSSLPSPALVSWSEEKLFMSWNSADFQIVFSFSRIVSGIKTSSLRQQEIERGWWRRGKSYLSSDESTLCLEEIQIWVY